MDEKGAALRQNAAGNDLRQVQAMGIEDHRASHRVKNHQQARARRFHEERALDHADAVSRQSAELGLLPHDLAALGIDSRERGVRRDEESAHRRELLPADVSLHLECPCRGRTRRGGRNGLSIELLRFRGYSAG